MGRFDDGGKTPLGTVQPGREAEGLRRRLLFAGQGKGARRPPLEGRFDRASRCGGFPHP